MAAAAGSRSETRMLVDGQLIEADSGKTFDNVNPATEEVLGQVAHASKAEMRRAIDRAWGSSRSPPSHSRSLITSSSRSTTSESSGTIPCRSSFLAGISVRSSRQPYAA